MAKRFLSIGLCLFLFAATIFGQTATPAAQTAAQQKLVEQANQLPQELRERALVLVNDTSEIQRARAASDLARRNQEPVIDFVIAVLNSDASARVRTAIVDSFSRLLTNPKVWAAIENAAVADAD